MKQELSGLSVSLAMLVKMLQKAKERGKKDKETIFGCVRECHYITKHEAYG